MLKSFPKDSRALEIRNLTLENNGEKIINDLSLNIQTNSITGLIGHSGSGKSSLFKSIFQIQLPHNARIVGEISVFGEKINKTNKRLIQPVFQDPIGYFNPRWTLKKILFEPMEINFRKTESEMKNQVISLLEEFGFKPEILDKNIREFSGGELQRFAILRAILAEPKIILMDEPISALDPLIQKDVVLFIKKLLKKRNLSILFISHDIEIVGWLCDYIYVIEKGRLVEEGKSKILFKDPKKIYTKELINSTYI